MTTCAISYFMIANSFHPSSEKSPETALVVVSIETLSTPIDFQISTTARYICTRRYLLYMHLSSAYSPCKGSILTTEITYSII